MSHAPATTDSFEIFLMATPGLEEPLCSEAKAADFAGAAIVPGGVTVLGGWREVWRANLLLRGAGRVVARIGSFPAAHLAQLDKRARKLSWGKVLRGDMPFRVEATCSASRIYHSGAAAERVERAIREELGAHVSADADVCIRVRIDNDICTIGVDTSGEPLHKRGHKEAVAKAPMRETMAAMLLARCGFDGGEPVLDPMCGSGTFIIEAAEIAMRLAPGRSRSFAFEQLATFDAAAWSAMRDQASGRTAPTVHRFHGSDRDAGAIRMSLANAARAGVSVATSFVQRSVEDLIAPEGPAGLVIVNPPYGARIGDKRGLHAVHMALGQRLKTRFRGWRVGLVTSESSLAKATGLPLAATGAPISHGGLRIRLWTAGPLA